MESKSPAFGNRPDVDTREWKEAMFLPGQPNGQ